MTTHIHSLLCRMLEMLQGKNFLKFFLKSGWKNSLRPSYTDTNFCCFNLLLNSAYFLNSNHVSFWILLFCAWMISATSIALLRKLYSRIAAQLSLNQNRCANRYRIPCMDGNKSNEAGDRQLKLTVKIIIYRKLRIRPYESLHDRRKS